MILIASYPTFVDTASKDNTVKVWDLKNMKCIFTFASGSEVMPSQQWAFLEDACLLIVYLLVYVRAGVFARDDEQHRLRWLFRP